MRRDRTELGVLALVVALHTFALAPLLHTLVHSHGHSHSHAASGSTEHFTAALEQSEPCELTLETPDALEAAPRLAQREPWRAPRRAPSQPQGP